MNVLGPQRFPPEHDPEQVAGMNHPDHMVQVPAVNGVARAAGAAHDFPDLLMVRPFRNGIYPDTRRHYLVNIQVIQVKQAVHDAARFFRQSAFS